MKILIDTEKKTLTFDEPFILGDYSKLIDLYNRYTVNIKVLGVTVVKEVDVIGHS